MNYYNPDTQMIISRQELKALLHASIPATVEEIGGWHRLYNGVAPETQHGQSIAPDEIVFENGRYVQKFKVVGIATPEETTIEERVSDLEDAVIELAEIIAGGE